jgi:hypothetical protein
LRIVRLLHPWLVVARNHRLEDAIPLGLRLKTAEFVLLN